MKKLMRVAMMVWACGCMAAEHAPELRATYSDGLKLSTADNAFSVQVGGRLQYDQAVISADAELEEKTGKIENDSGFRRALFKMSGTVHSNLDYLSMFDFSNDETKPYDNWIQLRNLPVLDRVRAGHFKEPMGLDILASSRDLLFMERAPVLLALSPIYNVGAAVMQNHADKRVYATAGVFRETDMQARTTDPEAYHLTGRLVVLPVASDDGKEIVHIGASGSRQNPADDTVRYAAKPQYMFAPVFADTKTMTNVSSVTEYGLEAAAVHGPLTFMAEFMAAQPDVEDDPVFSGWYVQAGWLLTGESHPYSRDDARFTRLRPLHNFTDGRGAGAWELVARQASLDLDSHSIHGGRLDTTTAGINWYLDPNLRILLDYVHADLADAGAAEIIETRLQFEF